MKKLVIYPEFPSKIRRNYDYDVSVTMDGHTEKIPVYNHTVESNVSRRPGADMYRRFSMFAFDGGEVRVDILVKSDFKRYTVFPSAKCFRHEFKDGVISVYLEKPDYFGIQLDDDQNSILSVFADLPEREEDIPDKNDPNVIYIDDWYETENGLFDVDKPNTTVYIAPGAVLNARVTVFADNCRVFGRGAIVDPFENLYEYDIQLGGTEGRGRKMLIINGKNNHADGLVLMDARCFNMMLNGSGNSFRNMKAMSSMMTTDGITSTGTGNEAEHCWLYVGDNGIVFSAKDTTYRDITIGTTCAALFPQCGPTDNNVLEDIYVFRADDGIVTNRYNGKQPAEIERSENVTIKRLSAVELPDFSTHFFQCANMGRLKKVYNFEDISMVKTARAIEFRNEKNDLYSDNFDISFKNMNIGGKTIKKTTDMSILNNHNADNEVRCTADDNFTAVVRNETEVGYTAPCKIFVGARQLFFKGIPTADRLPAGEICALLGKENPFKEEFVRADELVGAGVVKRVGFENGVLRFTPVYGGENLLLADEGEISHYAEAACWTLDLVVSEDDEGYIYNILNIKSRWAGMTRRITDEIRSHGVGTYRISLRAKGTPSGTVKLCVQEDKRATDFRFDVGEQWSEQTFEFNADENTLCAVKCMINISGDSNGNMLSSFAVRDLTLTKVK
ncbi:MAG: hypothetical protein ACI4QZ_03855 [Eubacteriales bacterium]